MYTNSAQDLLGHIATLKAYTYTVASCGLTRELQAVAWCMSIYRIHVRFRLCMYERSVCKEGSLSLLAYVRIVSSSHLTLLVLLYFLVP